MNLTSKNRRWFSTQYCKPEKNQKIYYFCKYLGIFRGEYFYDENSHGSPHKFHSEYGILDSDDVSYWMPYDHGLKDMIPLPPDYDKLALRNQQSFTDEIEIPESKRNLQFHYSISGDI